VARTCRTYVKKHEHGGGHFWWGDLGPGPLAPLNPALMLTWFRNVERQLSGEQGGDVNPAVLSSFWSPHPVRKEKSFLQTLQHFMYCFLYYQRSSHPKKSLLAPLGGASTPNWEPLH